MNMDEDELILPAIYNFYPLRALSVASRRKLSKCLDLEGVLEVVNNDGIECDVVSDYSGLAELVGFSYEDIMNMKQQKSPTTELLNLWTGKNGTVGELWMYLFIMGRYDVLTDCRQPIVQDCLNYEETQQVKLVQDRYNIEQDLPVTISEMRIDETKRVTVPDVTTSEMRVDETKHTTRQDVLSGKRTFYDAFICYTAEDENDRKFLYKMIEELEVKRHLKLFVPGRDDLPGSAEDTITAYLIEKDARSNKLIPVICEQNTQMPTILRNLAVCDFTKLDMVKWTWNRLFKAIIAPIGPTTYFDQGDPSNPFNMSDESLIGIKFPSHSRLHEHEDASGHLNDQSEPEASRSM